MVNWALESSHLPKVSQVCWVESVRDRKPRNSINTMLIDLFACSCVYVCVCVCVCVELRSVHAKYVLYP
jgi:hypothetical protein